jgi:regulator of sirC expression with transglutaminase-like and TPR domain
VPDARIYNGVRVPCSPDPRAGMPPGFERTRVTQPTETVRSLLAAEVRKSEHEMSLARAALLVAKEEYPQLPVDRYMTRLDQMAEEARDRLAAETAGPVVLQELIRTLYVRHGFRGNTDAYHDPRNSLLNDVLDRGLGIPLTLSIIFLEVGWRLGLPVEGVNFPAHFLIRYRGAAENILVDPFDPESLRFEDEAQKFLDRQFGGMVQMRPEFLRSATKRDMVLRLLLNLKGLYANARDAQRTFAVTDRILLIRPGAAGELRDSGMLLARMGRSPEARERLTQYLELMPEAEDAARIRALLAKLGEGGVPGVGDWPGEDMPESGSGS